MKEKSGDRIVLKGTRVDDPPRVGIVVEAGSPDGAPPYLVRWLDDGHRSLVYPGADAHVEPRTPRIPTDAGGVRPHTASGVRRSWRLRVACSR
ncbi:MAG: DUF1918 domain-containing protein [Stackebrandtia sp.]